ncbi:MAG: hypothetical protein EXQ55_10645 [Acidobacteria bacterium]|nr:hypothetical protein [Acidobacteriota bacterium]
MSCGAGLQPGRGLPRFVEQEFRDFLRCGWLAGGFARFRCAACGMDRLVAFLCKGRGFCPSCGGHRMAERAAHLVDRVFPDVPPPLPYDTDPSARRRRHGVRSRLVTARNEPPLICAVSGAVSGPRRTAGRRITAIPSTSGGRSCFLSSHVLWYTHH